MRSRLIFFAIFVLTALSPALGQAYDVLVLQSRRDPGYQEVLKGHRSGSNPSERIIVLSDYAEVDVARIVREDRPRVILAVGDAALTAAGKIQNTPVVAVMAPGVHNRNKPANLNGIGVFNPPERYTDLFKAMKVRRVGLVHNPAKSGWYVKLARQAASAAGIELVIREVEAPRNTIEKIESLTGKVDALWMLPDSTAVTRETVEAYFQFGQRHAVPVISFSERYLGLGAAAVLDVDRIAIGRQTAKMVEALLNGSPMGSMPPGFPDGTIVRTNPAVLKRLRVVLNEE